MEPQRPVRMVPGGAQLAPALIGAVRSTLLLPGVWRLQAETGRPELWAPMGWAMGLGKPLALG